MYLIKRLLAVAMLVFLATGLSACKQEEPAATPATETTAPDTGADTDAAPDTTTPGENP